jgi:hypothetical protein
VINSASDYLAYQAAMDKIMASQPQVISNEYGSYYMKDGVPIFVNVTIPKINVAGRSWGPFSLNLSEDEQLYLYELCEITGADYYLELGRVVHENNSNPNANKEKNDVLKVPKYAVGLMQVIPEYWSCYTDGEFYYCKIYKEAMDYAVSMGADLNNMYDPYSNLYVGVCSLRQSIVEASGNFEDGLIKCAGDTQSPIEFKYYRDFLAVMVGEEKIYE